MADVEEELPLPQVHFLRMLLLWDIFSSAE
jgi:hypothetical protein